MKSNNCQAFLRRVSEDRHHVCLCDTKRGSERKIEMKQFFPFYVKSDWNILGISHCAACVIGKGNLVLLQALWRVKTLWCDLSPPTTNSMTEPPPPCLSTWMLWEYLALDLTRLGFFIIPSLKGSVLAGAARLSGVPTSPLLRCLSSGGFGFSPTAAAGSLHPTTQRRYVRCCNKTETLRPTKTVEKKPDPNLLSEQITHFSPARSACFSNQSVAELRSEGWRWYAILWSYQKRNVTFLQLSSTVFN